MYIYICICVYIYIYAYVYIYIYIYVCPVVNGVHLLDPGFLNVEPLTSRSRKHPRTALFGAAAGQHPGIAELLGGGPPHSLTPFGPPVPCSRIRVQIVSVFRGVGAAAPLSHCAILRTTVMSCHISVHSRPLSCHVMPCHVTSCHDRLRRYVMLCYVMT